MTTPCVLLLGLNTSTLRNIIINSTVSYKVGAARPERVIDNRLVCWFYQYASWVQQCCKMPPLLQAVSGWADSPDRLSLQIPLHGRTRTEVDIVQTTRYLKV